MRRYRRLWSYFLECEAEEFEKERKLTIKEIKRIGIRKFIRANDWRCIDDVKKWRTDVLEVTPCPHCRKDFGVMDESMGLCPKCVDKFDIRRFYADVNEACKGDPKKIGQSIVLFMADRDFRAQYLVK